MPESGWAWQSPGQSFGSGKSERLLGGGRIERLTVTWYRNGGLFTGSNSRLKLAVLSDHLILRAQPNAMLLISATDRPDLPAASATPHFISSLGTHYSCIDPTEPLR